MSDIADDERDLLWDACLAEGHGPDAETRRAAPGRRWTEQGLVASCRGPNRDDDPCSICAEMAKQHPAFLARGGQEA